MILFEILHKLRERLYNLALFAGLFWFMPVVIHMPVSLQRFLLNLKAHVRFWLGTYRAYVNRHGLKDIAVKNISEILQVDETTAKEKIFRVMLMEVYGEKNGFLFDRFELNDLTHFFSVKGLNHLEESLKKRCGVIFTSLHSGDTVLFMLYLAQLGYNIYGLFDGNIKKKVAINPLHRFAILKDEKITGRIGKLYTGTNLKKIYEVLQNNSIVVWMIDLPAQSPKRRSIVSFLGVDIAINDSFWYVAKKSGAVVLPYVSIFCSSDERHNVHIGKPVDPAKNSIQDIFYFFEPYIKQTPESWLGWYYFDILKV